MFKRNLKRSGEYALKEIFFQRLTDQLNWLKFVALRFVSIEVKLGTQHASFFKYYLPFVSQENLLTI